MKKGLTFRDVYKFPLSPIMDEFTKFVYADSSVYAFKFLIESEAGMKVILDILNDRSRAKMSGKLTYDKFSGCVYVNGKELLKIRGWEYLTGADGLNLSMEEAAKIQDEFGLWICEKLQE